MIMSISLNALALVILAAVLTCNGQSYEEAAREALKSIPYDQLDEGTGMDGEASDYISDLWLDIEEAFRFLQDKQAAEELRRIRMSEISKRFRHHNFIRFGKRSAATPSFLGTGSDAPASPAEDYTPGTPDEEDNKVTTTTYQPSSNRQARSLEGEDINSDSDAKELQKRFRNSFVRIGRSSEDPAMAKRRYQSFVRIGRSSDEPNKVKKRYSNFVRIGRSSDAPNKVKRRYSNFVRIGRSVGNDQDFASSSTNPMDESENGNAFDRFLQRSLPINLRSYKNAKIGRLPAALFFHRSNNQSNAKQPGRSSSPRHHKNSFPRYG